MTARGSPKTRTNCGAMELVTRARHDLSVEKPGQRDAILFANPVCAGKIGTS
jgi:hypothetical protein